LSKKRQEFVFSSHHTSRNIIFNIILVFERKLGNRIFFIKVEKTVFSKFQSKFSMIGGYMGEMVACCAQLTLGDAEWSPV
jgi:hypothetical protein